jgi:hypothetical protein
VRHANVHPLMRGIVNAIAPLTCDDCEQPTAWEHAEQIDPWGAPTGEILCDNCAERRWDRQQEKLMEET